MKLTVASKHERFVIDVNQSCTIEQMKSVIANVLGLNASTTKANNSTKQNDSFQLLLHGRILNDDCTAQEVGLVSGSTLHCRIMKRFPYVLKIEIPWLGRTVELRDRDVCIETSTIGEVKSLLQNHVGIPVSIFDLRERNGKHVLFDNRRLHYYGISEGDTLFMNVWKGAKQLILSALNGDISQTVESVPSYHENHNLYRYYFKVVLFIAAHMDFVNLAAQVLQRGIRLVQTAFGSIFRFRCFLA